ncbi:MAG: hypothetical protein GF417_09325 [Candidatus Latescibacteria bacterium]|nr:hypothetical protein [bacterium]MBD3424625.1 hypothetical protein [Candidatus Latescibacterota bacterium]
MKKRTKKTVIAISLLTAGLYLFPSAAGSAGEFNPDLFLSMPGVKDGAQQIGSNSAAKDFFLANTKAFGLSKTTFDFIDKFSGGSYTKQIEAIMTIPKQKWDMHIGLMGGYRIEEVRDIVNKNSRVNITSRMSTGMSHIANGLSVISIMRDIKAGLDGNDIKKLSAIEGTVNLVQGHLISEYGGKAMGIAMLGPAVIGASLKAFMAEAQTQYADYWWNAYSAYLDAKYPNLVTGDKSWAALSESQGYAGIRNRLFEFWDNPYDNARFYGKAGIQTAPDLADRTLRDKFAARYYKDYVHTTLKTYYRMKADRVEAMAYIRAKRAWDQLIATLGDARVIQAAIAAAEKLMEDEEEKISNLTIVPASATLEIDESISFKVLATGEESGEITNVTTQAVFSGAPKGSFTATAKGDYTVTAIYGGLSAVAKITVEEPEEEEEEEPDLDEAVDDMEEDQEEDVCTSLDIPSLHGEMQLLASKANSAHGDFMNFSSKFEKELGDRAADPCGNGMIAYCYAGASRSVEKLSSVVEQAADLATEILASSVFCPDEASEAAASGYSTKGLISVIADMGYQRSQARSRLASMKGRLNEYGCDEEEVERNGERYTQDELDPDLLQDGGSMIEVPGDGVDNDANGLQDENIDALSGYNITCVLYDSGNLKDDVFDLSVSGFGRLGSTPAGGLRKFGLNIAPGTYTATVTIVSAPDNVGTFTLLILENGSTVGSLVCGGLGDSCPQGASMSVSFTVTGE